MRSPFKVTACFPPVIVVLVSLLVFQGPLASARARGDEGEGEKKEGERGEKAGAEKKEGGSGLEVWGTVQKVTKTDFYTFTYKEGSTSKDGKEAKKSVAAFLRIAEDATFLQDKVVRLSDLKEGETVWIFGRPVERETANGDGARGIDRQLQNVSAVGSGKDLKVNREYRNPKLPDSKWCETTVSKPGPAIYVKFDGNEYKVVMRKDTPVFVREEGQKGVLKNGAMIIAAVEEGSERPETKKAGDEKKPSLLARKVVVLDPRLQKDVYPILLK